MKFNIDRDNIEPPYLALSSKGQQGIILLYSTPDTATLNNNAFIPRAAHCGAGQNVYFSMHIA